LHKRIGKEKETYAAFHTDTARKEYREYMHGMQGLVGETVVIDISIGTGFCSVFDGMGLELFSYFNYDYPDDMCEFMEISTKNAVRKVHAVADKGLSPVVLIAEDFSTKQGPIFGPEFLHKNHYPYVKKLSEAWHSHDVKVIYHSDGNYKKAIPDLIDCGVDGFYCLEPNCGMDIVELKRTWPEMVWAGGMDGVNLMERGTPDDVKKEVHRHITETGALETGGMFIATSSEINPTIKPVNFKAMVDAAGEIHNYEFIELEIK
jgi:uroporphyrinogen decarboxylase